MDYLETRRIAKQDALLYGIGFIKFGKRHWYNPMRYLNGLFWYKRLPPRSIIEFYR